MKNDIISKPWSIQKSNDNMSLSLPSVEKIVNVLEEIKNPCHKALIALVYLTGCRISEVIRSSRYGSHMASIRSSHFEVSEHKGHEIVKIGVRTLKKRGKKKRESFRIIPVPLEDGFNDGLNKRLLGMISDYVETLEDGEELFKFKYSYAYKVIRKYTDWNCHWLRHLRTYHLLTHYNFREEKVRLFMGWTDLRPLSRYSSLKWMDLVDEYYK